MSIKSLPLLLIAVLSTFCHASSRCALNPQTYDFKLGKIRGTIVSDGPIVLHENLFTVSDKAIRRSYRQNYRASFPFVWQQNVAVLDTPSGRLMIDAGSFNIPEFVQAGQGGRLLHNLYAAGIHPSTIDAVLLTHGHPDHVSGLATGNGKKAFPNAKIYILKTEHRFWGSADLLNPNPNVPDEVIGALRWPDSPADVRNIYSRSIAPYGRDLVLVEKNAEPIKEVRFTLASGHSPGHSAIEISTTGKRIVFTGDAWISQPDQLQNPKWGWFFELDSKNASKTRIKLMKKLAKRRDLVLAFHENFPGLGFVSKKAGDFDWIPAQADMLGIVTKNIVMVAMIGFEKDSDIAVQASRFSFILVGFHRSALLRRDVEKPCEAYPQ